MSGTALPVPGDLGGEAASGAPIRAAAGDEALLERARGGDRHAFAGLVERHYATIACVLRQRAGPRAPIDDLMQEAFARALVHLPGFRRRASFLTWTTTIALHLATDWRRREMRRARLVPPSSVASDDVPCARSPAAEALAQAREDGALARAALDALPAPVRLAVTLRVVEELPYETVAQRLSATVPQVRTWVSRGLRRLRRELEVRDVEP